MTDRQAQSKRVPAGAAAKASQAVQPEAEPAFDPYKFSEVTVPADLRRQMLEARLARLEPEFFQDTLPPQDRLQVPPGSPHLTPVSEAPPRRRSIKLVLVCLLCALLLLGLALSNSPSSNIEVSRTPAPPKGSITLPAAGTEPSTAPTSAIAAAAPAIAEPTLHAAPKDAPAKAAIEARIATRPSLPRKSGPRQRAGEPEAPVAMPPSEAVPSPPAAPASVQTPWFNPK